MPPSKAAHYSRFRNSRWRQNRKAERYTEAGEVTITAADGTTRTKPAYTEDEQRRLVGSVKPPRRHGYAVKPPSDRP